MASPGSNRTPWRLGSVEDSRESHQGAADEAPSADMHLQVALEHGTRIRSSSFFSGAGGSSGLRITSVSAVGRLSFSNVQL